MAFRASASYNRALPKTAANEGRILNYPTRLIILLCLAAPVPALAEDIDAGLAAVKNLGTLNGQALACTDKDAAAHARVLMLAHAPKTQRFGTAYEEATQEGFLAQTRAKDACPAPKTLAARIDEVAQVLRKALPALPALPAATK